MQMSKYLTYLWHHQNHKIHILWPRGGLEMASRGKKRPESRKLEGGREVPSSHRTWRPSQHSGGPLTTGGPVLPPASGAPASPPCAMPQEGRHLVRSSQSSPCHPSHTNEWNPVILHLHAEKHKAPGSKLGSRLVLADKGPLVPANTSSFASAAEDACKQAQPKTGRMHTPSPDHLRSAPAPPTGRGWQPWGRWREARPSKRITEPLPGWGNSRDARELHSLAHCTVWAAWIKR